MCAYEYDPVVLLGIVYWTVLGRGSQFGSIKRAYMTTFNDNGNNPVKELDLNLRYIANPDGIAVDWIGGYKTSLIAYYFRFLKIPFGLNTI